MTIKPVNKLESSNISRKESRSEQVSLIQSLHSGGELNKDLSNAGPLLSPIALE
jgi:hypothetical protein